MRSKGIRWWVMLLMLPLGSVYGGNGCVADSLREVADDLENIASDIDGNDEQTVGEFLDDLLDEF